MDFSAAFDTIDQFLHLKIIQWLSELSQTLGSPGFMLSSLNTPCFI